MWEGLGANYWADSQLCSSYKLFQNNFIYLYLLCACVCVLCKKKKKKIKPVYFFGHIALHAGSSLLSRIEPMPPAVEIES